MLLLMAMASFMAHDTEPSYPRVKRQYERQFKKVVVLAGQRKHLHELFTKAQYAYVEGAQELIRAYRTSLQRHRPKEQIRILTEDVMPEFKTIEFTLQDPAGMTRFLEARVG